MPTHHYGADAPGLVTPAPDHIRPDSAPLGARAAPPAGLSPPLRDDGPPLATVGPSKGQGNADSADCADPHQPQQPGEAAAHIKRLATLRALLALAGWDLSPLPDGTHIVSRMWPCAVLHLVGRRGSLRQASGCASMTLHTTPPERIAALHAVRDRHIGLAAPAKRDRLLDALQTCGHSTTFEASRHLDLYDPRARAMELRRDGHQILTTRRVAPTESGERHLIGVYSLVKGAAQ